MMTLVVLLGGVRTSLAQFVINFQVDQQLAQAAFPDPERRAAMEAVLNNRVKRFLEKALVDSNAVLNVPVRWEAPPADNLAQFTASLYQYSWPLVRDRLLNVATDANEPFSELVVYENLPQQAVPFRWDLSDQTPRFAANCTISFAQAQQLQLNPAPVLGGDSIGYRPEVNGLFWQFWVGAKKQGFTRFDVVAALLAGVRELRPSQDASMVFQLNASIGAGAYPMSRGTRPSGDGRQASHFRSASRLNPMFPVGIMGPADGDQTPDDRLSTASRADMTVLDRLGWVLEPNSVALQIAGDFRPEPTLPADGATLRSCCPTFTWVDNTPNSEAFGINIFAGDPEIDPNPFPMMFYDIQGTTFTFPNDSSLLPGLYTWEVVGFANEMGGYNSVYRRFTILCPADFNGVGGVSPQDIFDFLAAWFNNHPSTDFNGVGGVTVQDVFDFQAAFFTPCP